MDTQLEPKHTAKILTYLGTLPFWYGILSVLNVVPLNLGLSGHQFSLDLFYALMAYTVVILSFIAGIHWGVALSLHDDFGMADNTKPKSSNRLLAHRLVISSNVIALWAWGVFVFFEANQAWLGLAFGFAVMLLIDKVWINLDKSMPWFWTLRWHASVIAIICLLMNGLL